MPFADIMEGIEQYRFSSELNLAAGTKAFRRGLREHDLVRRLTDLAKDAAARLAVAQRVQELSNEEIDTRYENRFDAALSAYLTVLGDTAQPEMVAKAASAAAKAPNCWWTVGISREMLTQAVATGVAEAPAVLAYRQIGEILPAAVWRESFRESLQEWFSQTTVSASDAVARHILSVMRGVQSQAPHAIKIIDMPLTEERERIVWRLRGRNRTARHKAAYAVASTHPRGGRQAVRA